VAITVKTCGLSTVESVKTAVQNGADMIGLNFFPRSPRYVNHETARALATQVSGDVTRVGLVVDPSNEEISDLLAAVPLDMLQLHGKESPERTSVIRKTFNLPVMKVLPVATASDLVVADNYKDVADLFLFDAKPPKGADRPGGNAVSFDWTLMKAYDLDLPWLLAGGLTPVNVADAIKISGARGVDAASGIESRPGVKDEGLIRSFIHAARQA